MEKAVERSVAPTSGGGYSPDFRVAVSRWKLSVRGQRSATPASPQPVSHPAWRNHPPQTATRRFKRQFFGQKSERRIGIGTGGRMSRDEWLTQPTRPEPQGRVMAAPTRKPATRRHGDEAVPFFDETRIPVDVIELPAPEIDGLAPEDYELIRHQENSRLALRAIPVGRRNGLFCWTELGARHVGILQSWIVTVACTRSTPATIRSMSCSALASLPPIVSTSSHPGCGRRTSLPIRCALRSTVSASTGSRRVVTGYGQESGRSPRGGSRCPR